jgi:inner membrane protein
MTGRTHDLAAVTTLTAALAYEPLMTLSLATAIVAVAANMIGGLTPDIDQPTAGFWNKIPAGSIFGHIINPLLGHHRMVSHSLVGMTIAGWGLKYLLAYMHTFLLVDMTVVWWAFMLGYASHLVMDSLTKEGVPWFFPIPVRLGFSPIKKFRVTTGGLVETIIVFPSLLAINGYLIYINYGKFIMFVTRYILR